MTNTVLHILSFKIKQVPLIMLFWSLISFGVVSSTIIKRPRSDMETLFLEIQRLTETKLVNLRIIEEGECDNAKPTYVTGPGVIFSHSLALIYSFHFHNSRFYL